MKKGLFAILAALAVFALVMTGCPADEGGGKKSTKTKIVFNVNKDGIKAANPAFADADIADLSLPAAFEIDKKDPLGTVARITTVYATDGIVNMGWAEAKDSTTLVTAASTFGDKDSVTLYAVWEAYDPVTVTFKMNGGWSSVSTQSDSSTSVHRTLTIATSNGAQMQPNAFKDQNTFKGWYAGADATAAAAATTAFTATTAMPATGNLTVWAIYTPEPSLATGVTDTAKTIPTDGEWVVVANGIYPMYKFTLPAGKTWGDYDGIEAEILVPGDWNESNSVRGGRLMGGEKAYNFKLFQYKSGVTNQFNYPSSPNTGINKFSVIHMGSDSNPWILDNWASWSTVHGFVTSKLEYTYVNPKDENGVVISPPPANAGKYVKGSSILDPETSYIPVKTYKTDASRKGGTYDMAKLPHAKATGPFYFGLGFSGDNNGTKQRIKNVVLKGKTGTADVIAEAAYFTADAAEYPAFIGYDGTASDGPANALYAFSDGGSSTDGMYRGNAEPVFITPEDPKAPATADLEAVSTPLTNTTAFSGGYNSPNGVTVEFTSFPTNLNISSYKSITVSVQASTDGGSTYADVTADSKVQFDYVDVIATKHKIGGSVYNIKTADTTSDIPQNLKDVASKVLGINVYNADASITHIKVTKVTLNKPTP